MQPTVLLDFDDTLVATGPLYEDALATYCARVEHETSVDRAVVRRWFDAIDQAAIALYGFSAQRFVNSAEHTYRRCCQGTDFRPDVARQLRDICQSVFTTVPTIFPGARFAVEMLRQTHRVILVTKGDAENQWNRLHQTGFAWTDMHTGGDWVVQHAFDAVEIVPDKDAAVYARILRDHALDPATTWSIGNSVKSDINPALANGCRAVWVRTPTWDYEQAGHAPGVSYEAATIVDAVAIVQALDTPLPVAMLFPPATLVGVRDSP